MSTLPLSHNTSQTVNRNVVLVTGAGSGIGKAAALRLGLLNYRVMCADIDEKSAELVRNAIMQNGGVASFLKVDVADEPSVFQMIEKTVHEFGRIDCAFNNAGVVAKVGMGRVQHWTVEEFDKGN